LYDNFIIAIKGVHESIFITETFFHPWTHEILALSFVISKLFPFENVERRNENKLSYTYFGLRHCLLLRLQGWRLVIKKIIEKNLFRWARVSWPFLKKTREKVPWAQSRAWAQFYARTTAALSTSVNAGASHERTFKKHVLTENYYRRKFYENLTVL